MVKRQRGTPTAISSGYLRTGRLWGSRAAGTGLASPLIIRQSCPFTFFAIERAISRISASRFVQVVSSLALSTIRSQYPTMTASLLVRSCAKTQCLPESSLCLSMSYHPSKSISEMIRGYVSGTLRQQSQRSVTAVTSNRGRSFENGPGMNAGALRERSGRRGAFYNPEVSSNVLLLTHR